MWRGTGQGVWPAPNHYTKNPGEIRRRRRFVGKAEAEQIESVNTKVPGEVVKVFTPHETRRAGADSMNKNQWWPGVLCAGSLVKNAPMLPLIESRFATDGAIVGFAG